MKHLEGTYAVNDVVLVYDPNSIYHGMAGVVTRLSSAGFILYYHVKLEDNNIIFAFRDFQLMRKLEEKPLNYTIENGMAVFTFYQNMQEIRQRIERLPRTYLKMVYFKTKNDCLEVKIKQELAEVIEEVTR